ncbi:MAG: sugar-binding protein [Schwartzia sp.]|nr:sugar-binding protein [Schwartzia sp. (in: firmicutes)]
MRRWTMFLTLAFCMICMTALTGCGGQRDGKAGGNPSQTVVILLPESSEIWHRSGLALKENLEKNGFLDELLFARTASEQTEQFRLAFSRKPLAIIVGAVDGDALKDVLAEAAKQGIPVIAYDRLIMNSPHVSYFVGYDAKEIGRSQARSIERALRLKEKPGSDNIEIFAGDPKDNNSHLFFEGAMEILKPYLDKGRLAVPSGETAFEKTATNDWSAQNAKVRMGRILQLSYANGRPLGAVLSPNDTLAGGIREALDLYYSGQWPFITGLDADPEGVRAIAADRQGMTIDKPPLLPVKECLRLVKDIAQGQSVPAPSKLDNGIRDVPAFLCKPAVIYKSNLESVHWAQ